MATVLIVDDDARIVELLERYIESLGHTPVSAMEGDKVLAAARQCSPALVILDFIMPDASGSEILLRLRNSPGTRTTPVIFLSGIPQDRLKSNVKNPRLVKFLEKPIDFAKLKQHIEEFLGKSNSGPAA